MILASLTRALRTQNWLAVFIEFVIVIAGVVIGFQITAWNEARAFRAQERGYLAELRNEIAFNTEQTDYRIAYSGLVLEGAELTLAFLGSDEGCEPRCVEVLISAFHASQVWATPYATQIHDEMQRLGLPTDPDIRSVLGIYYAALSGDALVAGDAPPYRTQVRSVLTRTAAEALWARCYGLIDGWLEVLSAECAEEEGLAGAARMLADLRDLDGVAENLRFWIGQNVLALEIYALRQQQGRALLESLDSRLAGAR